MLCPVSEDAIGFRHLFNTESVLFLKPLILWYQFTLCPEIIVTLYNNKKKQKSQEKKTLFLASSGLLFFFQKVHKQVEAVA